MDKPWFAPNETRSPRSISESGNHRVADYFVLCGLPAEGEFESVGSIDKSPAFEPQVLSRYPRDDHEDAKLPPNVPTFCFPLGFTVSNRSGTPTQFPFLLTDEEGGKMYCTALVFHELVPPTMKLKGLSPDLEKGDVFVPKCILLISRHMYLESLRKLVGVIYRLSMSSPTIPLERYIRTIIMETPLPPRGLARVKLTLGTNSFLFSRPSPSDLPLFDVRGDILFRCLRVTDVVSLVAALLNERKIAIRSKNTAILFPVCESLITLMYPFEWHYVYIPVLPHSLAQFLSAPMPYVIGFHGAFGTADVADDAILVDIDAGTVTVPDKEPIVELPKKQLKTLYENLNKCVGNIRGLLGSQHPAIKNSMYAFDQAPPDDEQVDFSLVRDAFLDAYAGMLLRYRQYVIREGERSIHPNPLVRFHKALFTFAISDSAKPFFSVFLRTQMWAKFLEKVTSFDEAGIDESVRILNRRIDYKVSLENSIIPTHPRPRMITRRSSAAMMSTCSVPPVDTQGLEEGKVYNYEPFILDEKLFGASRVVPALIASSESGRRTTVKIPTSVEEMHELSTSKREEFEVPRLEDDWEMISESDEEEEEENEEEKEENFARKSDPLMHKLSRSSINESKPCIVAAERGDVAALQSATLEGEDINGCDEAGQTPLHAASTKGKLGAVKYLLKHGAFMLPDRNGMTPLHMACSDGYAGIVKLLLGAQRASAFVESKGYEKYSPIHCAARNGHHKVLRLMIEAGSSLELKTEYGETPLHLAACYGHLKACLVLIEKGANTSAKDEDGQTPLDLAIGENRAQVVDVLNHIHVVDAFSKFPNLDDSSDDERRVSVASQKFEYV